MHEGMTAEACGGSEKNEVHRGAWRPDGVPAFVPVSSETCFHLVQQPTQPAAHQSEEEHRCVMDSYVSATVRHWRLYVFRLFICPSVCASAGQSECPVNL